MRKLYRMLSWICIILAILVASIGYMFVGNLHQIVDNSGVFSSFTEGALIAGLTFVFAIAGALLRDKAKGEG